MASDWQEVTLGEIAREDYGLVDGPFGSNLPASDYTTTGVPVIRGGNLSLGESRFNNDEFVFVSEVTAQRLARSLCYPGDIIFTKKGTLGQTGIVPNNTRFDKFLLSSNQMKLSVDTKKADPLFIYYAVSSPQSRTKIVQDSSVTGVPKTNLAYLREFPVVLPPQSEQAAIAEVLGSLDDKIELNRKMNETLEAIARAFFKSWFVDFDPVRAKAEGRDPGIHASLADLFPDSFEDSELGEIPKGWRVGKFGDVAANPRRSIGPDQIAEGTAYIALEHMPRKSIALSDWGVADEVESGKLMFHIGEILFGKLRPYFHKVGIAPIDGVCSADILVIAPSAPEWFGFVLEYASSAELVEHTNAASTGTKMPRTNWKELARFPLVLPSQEIATAFNDYIQPICARIMGASHENRTLVAIRDTLLPKLISGEIRIVSHGEVVI